MRRQSARTFIKTATATHNAIGNSLVQIRPLLFRIRNTT